MEEEDAITYTDPKWFEKYRDPVEPTLLSNNFAAVFLYVASLLNSRVELIVILNDITKDTNKVLEDESRKHVKLHRM